MFYVAIFELKGHFRLQWAIPRLKSQILLIDVYYAYYSSRSNLKVGIVHLRVP